MRVSNSLLFVVSVGLSSLSLPMVSLAQDTFGGVTNAPRPSEYLLWDAAAVARIKSELQQGLVDGQGIWDTGFIYARQLEEADYRPHSMSIVHRTGIPSRRSTRPSGACM